MDGLRLYLSRQAGSIGLYIVEQLILVLFGWIPTVVGIGMRALAYRLIMPLDRIAAIEDGVRIRFATQIHLGRHVYLDHGVYLHACPQGIATGDNSLIMHDAVLAMAAPRGCEHLGGRATGDRLVHHMGAGGVEPEATSSVGAFGEVRLVAFEGRVRFIETYTAKRIPEGFSVFESQAS